MNKYIVFTVAGTSITVFADDFSHDPSRGCLRFIAEGETIAIFQLDGILGFKKGGIENDWKSCINHKRSDR